MKNLLRVFFTPNRRILFKGWSGLWNAVLLRCSTRRPLIIARSAVISYMICGQFICPRRFYQDKTFEPVIGFVLARYTVLWRTGLWAGKKCRAILYRHKKNLSVMSYGLSYMAVNSLSAPRSSDHLSFVYVWDKDIQSSFIGVIFRAHKMMCFVLESVPNTSRTKNHLGQFWALSFLPPFPSLPLPPPTSLPPEPLTPSPSPRPPHFPLLTC